MRTFNNFYFSLRVIQYISFYFDQCCSCTLPMLQSHFANAKVPLYQCKSATLPMQKCHFTNAKVPLRQCESGTSSVLNYCVSPISSAFFISSCMSGSRSLATRLSSTASFRYCFSSPTCLHGGRLNIFIISLPSMTGCNRRL